MIPYYSFSNILIYTLSILFLCLLIPSLVYVKEYQVSRIIVLFLGFFSGFFVFRSLSGTCPYPAVKTLLFLLTVICISGTLFFGLIMINSKMKGRQLISFTTMEAHRWIMETLRGCYLITNPYGQILSCGQTVLSHLEPYHDETLISFLKRSAAASTNTANNREALESLYKKLLENKDSDGNIEISGRHYRWMYHRLGVHDLQGYLLFLTDLTEELVLINQREEAGKLLYLKNDWLRKQGRVVISLEQSRLAEELSQKTTQTITSHLKKLAEDLHNLVKTKSPDPKDINQALLKSKDVITQIRTAVHTLPYKSEKGIS